MYISRKKSEEGLCTLITLRIFRDIIYTKIKGNSNHPLLAETNTESQTWSLQL